MKVFFSEDYKNRLLSSLAGSLFVAWQQKFYRSRSRTQASEAEFLLLFGNENSNLEIEDQRRLVSVGIDFHFYFNRIKTRRMGDFSHVMIR